MDGKNLRTLLLAGTLAISGCSGKKLEAKVLREYTGLGGEKITESLFWETGDKHKNRQLDIYYPNGVHVISVDVFDDGKIDSIYVADNPASVQIVKRDSPEKGFMRLPVEQEVKQYFSSSR